MHGWRIVAQGRLRAEEQEQAARGLGQYVEVASIGPLARFLLRKVTKASGTTAVVLYDIDESALKVTSEGNTAVLDWSGLDSFDRRADGIWLYRKERIPAAFVPYRFLSSEERSTLDEFLARRLKSERAEHTASSKQIRLLLWMVGIGLALLAYRTLK